MKLVRVDTVALGAFNPAIPVPAWYVRLGMIAPNEAVSTELSSAGFPVKFSVPGLRWVVVPEQFVAELIPTVQGGVPPSVPFPLAQPAPLPADQVVRPGDFLAKTLDHLRHTPLSAVGNNFAFELEDESAERWRAFVDASNAIAQAVGGDAVATGAQVVVANAISGAHVTLAFSFSPRPGVSFNVNRVVGSAEEGMTAARQAQSDFAWAQRALQKLTTTAGV